MARDFIVRLIKSGVKPSISGDLWSDNGMGLFGIYAHGITETWVMEKALIGLVVVVLDVSSAAIEGETLRFSLPSGWLACPEVSMDDTAVERSPSGGGGNSASWNWFIPASWLEPSSISGFIGNHGWDGLLGCMVMLLKTMTTTLKRNGPTRNTGMAVYGRNEPRKGPMRSRTEMACTKNDKPGSAGLD